MREKNKRMLGSSRGPALEKVGLLDGLLRCRRCGRKLTITYNGKRGKVVKYSCIGKPIPGEKDCISFLGMHVDEAVADEVFRAVEPLAIEASVKGMEEFNKGINEQKRALQHELETAEYKAQKAYRDYNKVEPENRLIIAQLEAKWNSYLLEVERIKKRLENLDKEIQSLTQQKKRHFMQLPEELPKLWNAPITTLQMRKKLIRAAIEEVIADIDFDRAMVILDIHWVGNVHTRLEVRKNRPGDKRKGKSINDPKVISFQEAAKKLRFVRKV